MTGQPLWTKFEENFAISVKLAKNLGKNNKKTIRRTTLATIWRILAEMNNPLSPKLADKHDRLFQNWCAIS